MEAAAAAEETIYALEVPGLETTLVFATSAAAMDIALLALVLARNTVLPFLRLQVPGGMAHLLWEKTIPTWVFAALHAIMDTVHRPLAGLCNLSLVFNDLCWYLSSYW